MAKHAPSPRHEVQFVCTVGPAVADPDSLSKLHDAGMNIARINGSHGSLEDVRQLIIATRSTLEDRVRILLDLPGNKIRTDNIDRPIALSEGEELVLPPDRLTYKGLHARLEPGQRISAADGAIQLVVEKVEDENIHTRVLVGGLLANRKGINIRGIHSTIPFDFERDISLLNIAIEESVDYVGLSFVRSSEQVRRIKAQLIGTNVKVVAKVETAEAVLRLDSVLSDSHMIMIDRGDLEADVGREHVPLITKDVLARASELGVPAIVASQFLCSMLDRPLPFMAEVSDISHAILDGATHLMLSEETAIGEYPFSAVKTLRSTAMVAEKQVQTRHSAVILAAGDSKGFGSLTSNKHKCMLDVGGTTILQHQIRNLAKAGIPDDRITIVTGHNQQQVEAYLRGEQFRGSFVYNPWFATTNILGSLWFARPSGNTVVLYGDIIFDCEILTKLMGTPGDAVLAIDGDSPLTPEDEKVVISNNHVVEGSKELSEADAHGEFIGMARFSSRGMRMVADQMDAVMRKGRLMDFLTVTFEPLSKANLDLVPCMTDGRAWNDNDTLHDLEYSRDVVWNRILAAEGADA